MKQAFSKVVKRYEATAIVLGALGTVAAAIAFVFLTFVTVTAHEKAQATMKEYVDMRVKGTEDTLVEMKTVLDRIDERVYQLHKERGDYHGRKARN